MHYYGDHNNIEYELLCSIYSVTHTHNNIRLLTGEANHELEHTKSSTRQVKKHN
jgi:hypothetical protein